MIKNIVDEMIETFDNSLSMDEEAAAWLAEGNKLLMEFDAEGSSVKFIDKDGKVTTE